MKRLLYIIGGAVCLYLAYMTVTGEILNYINFADPLNEMGFFACLTVMGGMLIFCGVAKDTEVPCSRELDMEMANESENIQ